MQPNDQQQGEIPQEQAPQPPVMPQPQPAYVDAVPQENIFVEQAPIETEVQTMPTELPQDVPVLWQDIEYIQHDQGPIWYVGFVAVVIILIIGAVLLQAWTFIPLIIVMAVALVIYTHRPARQLQYSWSGKGLTINDQLHPAGEFRSFGVIQDGAHNAIIFIPVKRFRPGLTVYFPAEVGEQLVDAVGAYLPMEELHLDAFDKIIRKLRI